MYLFINLDILRVSLDLDILDLDVAEILSFVNFVILDWPKKTQ